MNGHKVSWYSQVSKLAPEFRLDSVFADKLNTVDVRATKDGVVRWEIADNGSEFPVITIMPESPLGSVLRCPLDIKVRDEKGREFLVVPILFL